MTKQAQFSFTADLFMMQTLLRVNLGEPLEQHEYVFPTRCYRQVVEWLLENVSQVGIEPIQGFTVKRGVSEVRVTFPNEDEQDKMHRFFEKFNEKRRQAQGIDSTFPPMPDLYQGDAEPDIHIVGRYTVQIMEAFDGESSTVCVPVGPDREEFAFSCG